MRLSPRRGFRPARVLSEGLSQRCQDRRVWIKAASGNRLVNRIDRDTVRRHGNSYYFADEPNAEYFSSAIEDLENLLIPTICLYEVFRVLIRQSGEDRAFGAIGAMLQGTILNLDTEHSLEAAAVGSDQGACRRKKTGKESGSGGATWRSVWGPDGCAVMIGSGSHWVRSLENQTSRESGIGS